MRERLSYHEAARQFEVSDHHLAASWERICIEEDPEGLYVKRRRRGSKERTPKKLKPEVEEDLLTEVHRLRAENAYLKNECLGCRAGTAREKANVIWELRHEHKLLLDVAGLPRSTYYYCTKSQKKPNQKWVTDVTEFSLFGEKLYLSPILDLCCEDLVSYTISGRPALGMVTTMLEKAFETIPDGTKLILRSDQGWQYRHKYFQRLLEAKGARQSMSRIGTAWIMP